MCLSGVAKVQRFRGRKRREQLRLRSGVNKEPEFLAHGIEAFLPRRAAPFDTLEFFDARFHPVPRSPQNL